MIITVVSAPLWHISHRTFKSSGRVQYTLCDFDEFPFKPQWVSRLQVTPLSSQLPHFFTPSPNIQNFRLTFEVAS
jgi:hypothetical protein